MARIIIAPEADADTDGIIADLIAKAGVRVAVKYNNLFEKLYERLADHPGSGAPRPALGANMRIGIISPYIVVYRHSEADDTVTVLRIVHGRRRISGSLLRETRRR
jgi:toxin ParE1/3/4